MCLFNANFISTAQCIAQQINAFSQRSCSDAITVLEKCEQNRSQIHYADGSMAKENDIGESYYRLALFCSKQSKAKPQLDEHQLEMEKLLIISVLRGMQHGSKNARLQFPRLLQLPNINTKELTDIFNREVAHYIHFRNFYPSILF